MEVGEGGGRMRTGGGGVCDVTEVEEAKKKKHAPVCSGKVLRLESRCHIKEREMVREEVGGLGVARLVKNEGRKNGSRGHTWRVVQLRET
jgi:hypothetical protein